MPVRLPAIAILTDLYAQRAKEILDAKDADGCVPLHYAISEKHEATCDCLVELGASVEVGFAGSLRPSFVSSSSRSHPSTLCH